ncbi:MAG: hypothetical protein HRU31_13500 [Rhodobacteraceae bacterium]|nr:hypothetical protein [Paracoccaceae bacterium]
MSAKPLIYLAAVLLLAGTAWAKDNKRTEGAIKGAVIGAGVGAIIGDSDTAKKGALIGAIAGNLKNK